MKRKREKGDDFGVVPKKRKFNNCAEVGVGIEFFLLQSEKPRFFGVIKQRACDFHVHEIFQGKVITVESVEKSEVLLRNEQEENAVVDVEEKITQGYEALSRVLPTLTRSLQDDFKLFYDSIRHDPEKLRRTIRASDQRSGGKGKKRKKRKKNRGKKKKEAPSSPQEEVPVFRVECQGSSKESRRKIHSVIKDHFPNLASRFVSEHFEFYFSNDNSRTRWMVEGRPCVQFHLFKKNIETKNAISILANFVHVSPKRFSFMGNKDKRACTTQCVRAFKVEEKQFHRFNKFQLARANNNNNNDRSSVELGNANPYTQILTGHFSYHSENLKIGQLDGNLFHIVLRHIIFFGTESASCSEIKNQVSSFLSRVTSTGFINYFGMQRFGTCRTPTHELGRLVLQRKWRELCRSIIENRLTEISDVNGKGKRKRFQRRNEVISSFLSLDDLIHHHKMKKQEEKKKLKEGRPESPESEKEEDSINISQRLKTFFSEGLLRGYDWAGLYFEKRIIYFLKDLYEEDNGEWGDHRYKQTIFRCLPRPLRTLYVHSFQSWVWNVAVSARMKRYGYKNVVVGDLVDIKDRPGAEEDRPEEKEKGGKKKRGAKIKVKWVESEKEAKSYGIEDVVMPAPGCDILYPKHEINEGFFERMVRGAGEDMELDIFGKHGFKKEFGTYGNYRKIVIRPEKKFVKWKFVEYEKEWYEKSLVPSDWDRVMEKVKKEEKEMKEEEEEEEDGGFGNFDFPIVDREKYDLGEETEKLEELEEELEEKDEEEEKKVKEKRIGFAIQFALPAGSYATMFLREILRVSSVLRWKDFNEKK